MGDAPGERAMIVTCNNCKSAFTVNDDKVRGKKFAFNCPKCSHNNIINMSSESVLPKAVGAAAGAVRKASEVSEDSFFDIDDEPKLDSSSFSDNKDAGFEDNDDSSLNFEDTDKAAEDDFDDFAYEDEIEPEIDLSLLQKDVNNDASDQDIESFDDDLSIDLDSMDIPLEDSITNDADTGLTLPPDSNEDEDDDDIVFDLDAFDDAPPVTEASSAKAVNTDVQDDTSFELDSLDLDLTNDHGDDDSFGTSDDGLSDKMDAIGLTLDEDDLVSGVEELSEDERLSIDLNSLDIDLDEEEAPALSSVSDDNEDEALSIDLNSLDIDLDESDKMNASDEDDTLSIDLNSLDVDLEDGTQGKTPEEEDLLPFDIEDGDFDDTAPIVLADDEIPDDFNTDDLAIDVNPADLGITPPAAGNAGTRISRLAPVHDEPDYADETYSLDMEIDDDETIFDDDLEVASFAEDDTYLNERDQSSGRNYSPSELLEDNNNVPLSDLSFDTMPELDLERMYDEQERESVSKIGDDLLDIDAPEIEEEQKEGVAGSGYINFSIDYTIKYSRLRALFKLSGLFTIALLPHFFVLFLYSMVSSICGLFNNLITLFNGETERDFTRFQEKTLRYATGVLASLLNVTEDRPPYAGKEDVDTELQLQAYPPIKYSRFLAFMRLSLVGILFLSLPHLIITAILTVALIPFTVIGLLSTLLFATWPSFLLDYTIRYLRYLVNVNAFITGIVDAYPSFRFD